MEMSGRMISATTLLAWILPAICRVLATTPGKLCAHFRSRHCAPFGHQLCNHLRSQLCVCRKMSSSRRTEGRIHRKHLATSVIPETTDTTNHNTSICKRACTYACSYNSKTHARAHARTLSTEHVNKKVHLITFFDARIDIYLLWTPSCELKGHGYYT